MKPSALLCFLAAVAAALAADAAGTNTVEKFAYRGTLANADGSAFASALPMQMTFRLYDRETGGKPLWGRAGERGILLPSNPSPDEAASAWTALLRDSPRARELGAAAKAFVLARHAPSPVLDRWEAFYRSRGL